MNFILFLQVCNLLSCLDEIKPTLLLRCFCVPAHQRGLPGHRAHLGTHCTREPICMVRHRQCNCIPAIIRFIPQPFASESVPCDSWHDPNT
ncbi:hypothetical protein BGW80DRAFT_1267607 [Lactifluus volemus]|nr:hypothetical protein BGW80DRAFT_1267607 [Lactifluus volemus]